MENQTNINIWDFVEKYHPNYSNSDDILHCSDLMLIEEERDLTQEEMEQLDYLKKCVYEESIENFIKVKGEL